MIHNYELTMEIAESTDAKMMSYDFLQI